MHICYNVGKFEVPIDVDFDSRKSDNVLKFERTILHQEASMRLNMQNPSKISLRNYFIIFGGFLSER